LELALAYGNHYNLIHEIKQALPILDAIRRYLPGLSIQQRGRKHWACCPFHSERTPSFLIDTAKERAICYGCGWHGDSLDIALQITGWTIQQLAADIGITNAGDDGINRRQVYEQQRRLKVQVDQLQARIDQTYILLCICYKATFKLTNTIRSEADLDRVGLSAAFDLAAIIEYLLDELYSNDAKAQYTALLWGEELTKDWVAKKG